jgi:transcriptional regulator with XRE-family HTH domain
MVYEKNIFDPKAFGASIKARMEALGMTFLDAEVDSGVGATTLFRVTRKGSAPSVENYLRLTRWLGASASRVQWAREP